MLKQWFKLFWVWRLWLFLVVLAAIRWVGYRPAFEFTGLPFYNPALATWLPASIWAWANFDGVIFLQNAAHALLTEVRFLPLYSFLIKILSGQWQPEVVSWQQLGAGLVIAHVCTVLLIKYLHQLLRLDFSATVVHRTFLWLMVFPTSFFFVSLYTESLFLLIAVGSFLAARNKKWWLSFLLVGLASVTRLPGILLLIPIGWEWWNEWRKSDQPLVRPAHMFYAVLACLPLVILMFWHARASGDPLAFVHAHGELANSRSTSSLVFPAITVVRYLKILLTLPLNVLEWWVALLELASAGWLALMMYWSWQLKLRTSYQLYTLSMAALPVLSGTFSGLPRYLLIIFPIYLVLALKIKKGQWGIALALFVLQMILLICFSRGYYIA